jgi:hypothetical protein
MLVTRRHSLCGAEMLCGVIVCSVLCCAVPCCLQLEAYNARDLEAFMDLLAEDCAATDAVTGAVLGKGKAELRCGNCGSVMGLHACPP